MAQRTVPGSPDAGKLHPYNHEPHEGDIVVDVIRPRDLVAVTVTVRGATLEPPGDPTNAEPHPVSTVVAGDRATLVVDFPHQHGHEQASYEISEPSLLPDPMHPEATPKSMPTVVVAPAARPARYTPARGSRLVFALPEGARIPFDTRGLLGALPWLESVLHPLAQAPGIRPPRYEPPGGLRIDVTPGLEFDLEGGLVARVTDEGVVIAKQTAAARRARRTTGSDILAERRFATNARFVSEAIAAHGASLGRGVRAADVGGAIGELLDPGRVPPQVLRRGTYSRKATLDETSIEAPFRLQLSPTSQGHWVHASAPAPAEDAAGNVELWHTRLDTGLRTPEDLGRPGTPADERTRVVRAIWTRDRDDLSTADWRNPLADQGTLGSLSADDVANGVFSPFLGSLDRADRHRLVRQSAEAWPGTGRTTIAPVPVGADKLWLTALGSWLEVHGQWQTGPYSDAELASILAWDHIATGGRDQYVRVVYPGYLYPLGQPTVLVKLTERSIRPQANPRAELFQRQFLVVIDPVRIHPGSRLPFTRTALRPLVTPNLDPPVAIAPPGLGPKDAFWPMVGGKPFSFRVDAEDREHQDAAFPAPLLWVAEHVKARARLDDIDEHYAASAHRVIDMKGQPVSFTPKTDAPAGEDGDARVQTQIVRLRGTARPKGSDAWMSSADVVLPAAQAIAGTGSTTITYYADYREHGYTAGNAGRVWAATVTGEITGKPEYSATLTAGAVADPVMAVPAISFGGQPGDVGSDRAGGFIQPNLTVRGLSTKQGAVGDLDTVAAGTFDPVKLLGDALPKLFGIVKLTDILPSGALAHAPALITDALDSVTALVTEVQRAEKVAADAAADAQRGLQALLDKGASQVADAQQLVTDAAALASSYTDLAAAVPDLIAGFAGMDAAAIDAALTAAPDGIRPRIAAVVAATRAVARAPLPLFARTRLQQLADSLGPLADVASLAGDLVGFLGGLNLDRREITFRYDWTPVLHSWPSEALPLLKVQPDSLLLAVRGTLEASGPPSVDVLAELRDFQLNLFSKDPLLTIRFDHLSYRSGSTGKTEVDAVMTDIVFGGFLEFVETLKDLIPLDGFSDPPFLDSTEAGLTLGFTLALPNVAVGVFNLSNLSVGIDAQIPYLGQMATLGFNFCGRDKPFVLAVVFLGGGGWFVIRMSMRGLEFLELGLEAGAYLALDFGVASGSVSAALGIYLRMEDTAGSLTGYFRIRGEVDVMGLISASIELYLELVYRFETGKLVGRASITVEVEVLCFSASVSIETERQFAGSNGDPTLRDVVMEPDGSAPAWDDYLLAFAMEEVQA